MRHEAAKTSPSLAWPSASRPASHRARPSSSKNNETIPSLPTDVEAQRLLDVVMFYVGQTQHHFEHRELADRVSFFYTNSEDPVYLSTPWGMEIVLVFAIGKLIDGDFGGNENSLPGTDLFHFVYTRIPTLSELYSLEKIGVELLALVAMYLQNVNRKEEAYVYVSLLQLDSRYGSPNNVCY